MRLLGFLSLIFFCLPSLVSAQGYVWWEGEDCTNSNFPSQTWLDPSSFPENAGKLSEGSWFAASGKVPAEGFFASYKIEVPAAGKYNLWTRKFWQHGPFKWRFDETEWVVCGKDCALADTVELKQYVCANWVFLGKVELSAGSHELEIRLLASPGEEVNAAFDCFVLTPGPFIARGRMKPDEKSGKAEKGWFAWEPGIDGFATNARLDLRFLNEPEAGINGYVRSTNSGFVTGDGKPLRFWGVNVGQNNLGQDRDSVDYMARALAKKGVNAVRVHGGVWIEGDPGKVDPKKIGNLRYAVEAFKKQGIYTEISLYFPLWLEVKKEYGIEGYETIKNKFPFGLIYFEPKLRSYYTNWLRAIFTSVNTEAGADLKALKDEPAVALVELVNEDSFFFWTFSRANFPDVQWKRLEVLFADWLSKKYGRLAAAFAAWNGEKLPDDDAKAGIAGLYDIWHLTADGLKAGGEGKKLRAADQAAFLAGLQRRFYAETVSFLRKNLGVKSLIVPSNWTVADARLLDPIEKYTYTAGDVVDRHGYFGGKHTGDGADWSVRVGHKYNDRCGMTNPGELPIQFFQVDGYPQIISEIGWTAPNRFRAEGTFLASAWGGLQSCDGFFFFAVSSDYLQDGEVTVWPVGSPAAIGTFPAASLAFRRGSVASGDSLFESLSVNDVLGLKGSALMTPQALDSLRAKDVPSGRMVEGDVSQTDPFCFYTGRVSRAFTSNASGEKSWQADLSKLIDRDSKIVKSVTGELRWDYGNGVAVVDAPAAQGACGFLSAAKKIELGNISILSRNDYGSVSLVSLDGRPIAVSARMLLQVMTEERMCGFRSVDGKIESVGGPPYTVRLVAGSVRLRNLSGASVASVTALDENGYASGRKVRISGDGVRTGCEIRLLSDVLYYIVER